MGVVLPLLQNIPEIPDDLKLLYKTVWEISQKTLINMAADRGAFIDQSQSFNVHMAETNVSKMTSMHFYAWKKVGVSHRCIYMYKTLLIHVHVHIQCILYIMIHTLSSYCVHIHTLILCTYTYPLMCPTIP